MPLVLRFWEAHFVRVDLVGCRVYVSAEESLGKERDMTMEDVCRQS